MPIIKTDKETIITKSIHLFKVHGYYNTTMANIGEANGLIKGSIYHHFKSKEDLALECLKYIHEFFKKNIFSIAKDQALSDLEQLERFTKEVECYFLNSEGGCLLGNFALEVSNNLPLLKEEILTYFNHWEQALYEILKAKLGKKKAEEEAKKIVANTQGCIMMMRLYNSTETFKTSNTEILKLLS